MKFASVWGFSVALHYIMLILFLVTEKNIVRSGNKESFCYNYLETLRNVFVYVWRPEKFDIGI